MPRRTRAAELPVKLHPRGDKRHTLRKWSIAVPCGGHAGVTWPSTSPKAQLLLLLGEAVVRVRVRVRVR